MTHYNLRNVSSPAVASPEVADTTKLEVESARGIVFGAKEKESAVSKALFSSMGMGRLPRSTEVVCVPDGDANRRTPHTYLSTYLGTYFDLYFLLLTYLTTYTYPLSAVWSNQGT